jgi:hypothetical protein
MIVLKGADREFTAIYRWKILIAHFCCQPYFVLDPVLWGQNLGQLGTATTIEATRQMD